MAETKTTVIIPIWNRVAFFDEAIRSVIDQTCPDWNLIVAVDTDEPSREIVEVYSRHLNDPRVRVTLGRHAGQSTALNRAVSIAKTPFCSRLDSDDMLTPWAVQTLNEHIDFFPQAGYFYTHLQIINEKSEKLAIHECEDFSPVRLEEWYITRHWNNWRVRDFAIAGGFREDFPYSEDYLLPLKMMLHGTIFVPIKSVLYLYRMGHGAGCLTDLESSHRTYGPARELYKQWKRELGVSLEGEDPSYVRPENPLRWPWTGQYDQRQRTVETA